VGESFVLPGCWSHLAGLYTPEALISREIQRMKQKPFINE